MISKQAVKQFLKRERADFRGFKKLSRGEVAARMKALPWRPPIWAKLKDHQKICFLIGAQEGRFGFFLDPGMGKTMLSIALARFFKRQGTLKHMLVLVPRKINKAEWKREIQKHSPSSRVCILSGTSKEKWYKLETTKALFIVETYAGLTRMLTVEAPGKKKKKVLKPDKKKVDRMIAKVQAIVPDESTFLGNHRSLTHRICRAIAKEVPYAFALTGTPFGRDPAPLWGQLVMLDGGETLGETLGLFRAALFKETKNYWGGFEYTFDPKKEAALHRMLAGRTIRYEADEGDLPKLVPITRGVHLPNDTQHYYDIARDELIKARGNFQEMKNSFLRMRQISSGFLGYKDDEDGSKAEIEFHPNPKLESLLSDVLDIVPAHKCIIFHDFIFSGSIICRELTRAGIGWGRIGGATKDPEKVLRDFDKDKNLPVLVLNNSCGAFGLNLQVARYGLVYESPVSVINRKQAIRRFRRQHSEHGSVFLYDYVVEGTVDQQILDFHSEGKDLFEAIIEGKIRP